MDNTKLLEFAKTLSGVYDNLEQSQQNPQNFARINIYFRPLPWEVFNAPGFYSEQCYDYAPWDPYRQGIHKLTCRENLFVMENYGIQKPKRLAGAGKNPDILEGVNGLSMNKRCGCAMHFEYVNDGKYVGKVEPGKKCLVPRDGKMTYLVSEVEVNQETWTSRDRGYDPKTDQQVWGSEHGLLKFKRIQYLDKIIDDSWINRFK